jgi:hypothetical protein
MTIPKNSIIIIIPQKFRILLEVSIGVVETEGIVGASTIGLKIINQAT